MIVHVLVTGSRDYSNPAFIWQQLDAWRQAEGNAMALVVGDCPTGADAAASSWPGALDV